MPFIAIGKNSGERIVVTKLADPRSFVKGREFKCQLCEKKMFLRGGCKTSFHFYHSSGCHSNYSTNPETPQHIAGKSYIAEEFLPLFHEYADFRPEYEVPVPEVMRVADIMVSFPMGWRIAHEIQLSPISVNDLEQRTNDYLEAGIDVLWWFGKGADTVTNRDWAVKRYHFSLSLAFDDAKVSDCGCYRQEVSTDRYGDKHKYLKYRSNAEVISTDGAVVSIFATWWLDHSFARYYQTWQRGNNDMYKRGLFAAKRTLSSFNGKAGTGKDKWCTKENVKGDEVWVVDLSKYLPKAEKYEIAIRLSPVAIQRLKARARANS